MRCKHKYIVPVVLCAVFLFVGCRPKGILSSEEMRAVLVDLHKTDAMIQVAMTTSKDSSVILMPREVKDIYYAQVLEKHGITQAQFDSSIVWYTAHPLLFNKIYPKVMADLKAEEERFIAAHEAELTADPKQKKKEDLPPQTPPTPPTKEQMDSIIWVMLHGEPTLLKTYSPEVRYVWADER